ncbi:MAG: hypothetical protein ACI8RD_014002, partial [Bacillariaceae sp.]
VKKKKKSDPNRFSASLIIPVSSSSFHLISSYYIMGPNTNDTTNRGVTPSLENSSVRSDETVQEQQQQQQQRQR